MQANNNKQHRRHLLMLEMNKEVINIYALDVKRMKMEITWTLYLKTLEFRWSQSIYQQSLSKFTQWRYKRRGIPMEESILLNASYSTGLYTDLMKSQLKFFQQAVLYKDTKHSKLCMKGAPHILLNKMLN